MHPIVFPTYEMAENVEGHLNCYSILDPLVCSVIIVQHLGALTIRATPLLELADTPCSALCYSTWPALF